MDIDMILAFIFVLAIITIVSRTVLGIVNRSLEHRERMKLVHEGGEGSSVSYRTLEDRVRVLERIATDGNPRLAREIEELRELDTAELEQSKAS